MKAVRTVLSWRVDNGWLKSLDDVENYIDYINELLAKESGSTIKSVMILDNQVSVSDIEDRDDD